MSLKYPVKINRVNNLSDARYCAGMGVELIGITNEISIQEYTAITGWITGVALCLDLYEVNEHMVEFVNQVNPEYLEISDLKLLNKLQPTNAKIIYRIEQNDYDTILQECKMATQQVNLFNIITSDLSQDAVKNLSQQFDIIVSIDGYTLEQIDEMCEEVKPHYISLNGGKEVAPGLKNFDEMAEVLEFLETSNE